MGALVTPTTRVLWQRTLLATLVHLLLLFAWPALHALYAPAFRWFAQFAVAFVDPLPVPIDARFTPGSGGVLDVDLVRMDTVVSLHHRELEGADASFGASSFFHAWFPTSVLLALFLAATPLAWRTRRWRLALGLALLHLFIALRCALAVYHCLAECNIDGTPLVELGPLSARVLELGWHFAWGEAFANYMVPLVIWALCAFGPRAKVEGGA